MQTVYRFGNAQLRPDERLLLVEGKQTPIGPRAFDLLIALVERRDRIVPKSELLDRVWPGLVVEENNLEVHVSSLRKVLGRSSIATVPGRGYRFTAVMADQPDGSYTPSGAPQLPAAAANDAQTRLLTNVPARTPTLIGREIESHALRALLDSHPLVTVTGAGGIGKTALVQSLGHELVDGFPDGVWHVELASVASGSLVANAIANVLQLRLGAGSPSERLAGMLAESHMLVVLDNCEHVTQAVAELALALYRCAPKLRLLATSQEPLKLAHEQVFRLGPLEVPAEDANATRAGAVALFEARARGADGRFELGTRNLPAVIDICRQLDGIPLAIELAAARVPLLGVDGLRDRLVERFRVLKGSARDTVPRHQTLRAAMEWSHGLLTAEEQTVLRRLAVFVGGFRLESAQHVARGEEFDEWAVLDHLGALVDKSLVVAQGEPPRYRLLETTRAFAREMLESSGEEEPVRRRHCQAVLALCQASNEAALAQPVHSVLVRYLPDIDDVRAALAWADGPQGDPLLHIALAGSIAWLWDAAGLHQEGVQCTARARARIDASTPADLEARLEGAWSTVAWPRIGPDELRSLDRAAALFRQLGDTKELYRALCRRSRILGVMGRFDEAERSLQEAHELFSPDWPRALHALELTARGCGLLERGDAVGSMAVYGQRLQLAIELGDRALQLSSMINMEQGCAMLGLWNECVSRGWQMMKLLDEDGVLRRNNEIYVVGNLTMALAQAGQVAEATRMARRSLALHEQWDMMLCAVDQLMVLAFRRGHLRDAARMLGHSDAAYARSGQYRMVLESSLRDSVSTELQQQLGADEMSRLRAQGEALGADAAARLALREHDGPLASECDGPLKTAPTAYIFESPAQPFTIDHLPR